MLLVACLRGCVVAWLLMVADGVVVVAVVVVGVVADVVVVVVVVMLRLTFLEVDVR